MRGCHSGAGPPEIPRPPRIRLLASVHLHMHSLPPRRLDPFGTSTLSVLARRKPLPRAAHIQRTHLRSQPVVWWDPTAQGAIPWPGRKCSCGSRPRCRKIAYCVSGGPVHIGWSGGVGKVPACLPAGVSHRWRVGYSVFNYHPRRVDARIRRQIKFGVHDRWNYRGGISTHRT